MQKILVTGCAGFIGSNLVNRLLKEGKEIVGIDNFNDYYDPKLKERNIVKALDNKRFLLYRGDILDYGSLLEIFKTQNVTNVIHLAARAGVRPSIDDPLLYAKVNVEGTINLLKLSAENGVRQFIFGSSSSVYGNSNSLPFLENDLCQNIISPYGATKRAAEFFVESFFRNFGLKSVILRFFTVYGPGGRPDMAPALFTRAIWQGEEISKFGKGNSARDYTYIEDIIEGIAATLVKEPDFDVINLGNNNPVELNEFIKTIEEICGKKAKIRQVPPQSGDSEKTWANIEKAKRVLGWEPKTKLKEGMQKYFEWYKNYEK